MSFAFTKNGEFTPHLMFLGFSSVQEFIATIVCVHVFFLPFLYLVIVFSSYWPLAVVYASWIAFDKSPFKDGRYSVAIRNLQVFRTFAKYFPSKVVCDTPLEDKQYLFSYSPHGIIGTGSFCTLGTNANNFAQHYKRPLRVVTIDFNFYMPFFRDLFILMGYLSCSKKTMDYNLKRGQSLVVVLGGASEVAFFDKYNYNVIVDKRFGFFKLALENGVDIVPVFTFGENDIHTVIPVTNKYLLEIQQFIKNSFGFLMIPFHGVFALLPHREPLTTIIGQPISVKLVKKPTVEQVNALQELYKIELKRIFDKYQPKYGKHIQSINFVE